MYKIEFDPIDLVLACPHKWYLLEKLNSGIVLMSSLYADPRMREKSVNRHIQEMIDEGLIELSSDGYLAITTKGVSVANNLQKLKKIYRKKILA